MVFKIGGMGSMDMCGTFSYLWTFSNNKTENGEIHAQESCMNKDGEIITIAEIDRNSIRWGFGQTRLVLWQYCKSFHPTLASFVKVPNYCSLMTTLFCLYVTQDYYMKYISPNKREPPSWPRLFHDFWHGRLNHPLPVFYLFWYSITIVLHPYVSLGDIVSPS